MLAGCRPIRFARVYVPSTFASIARSCQCGNTKLFTSSLAVHARVQVHAQHCGQSRTWHASRLVRAVSAYSVATDGAVCSRDVRLPPGLYLVGTPIGNLEDLSVRALKVLQNANIILAEDTRHSRKLLNHYDIKAQMHSFHQHNEHGKQDKVCVAHLAQFVACLTVQSSQACNDVFEDSNEVQPLSLHACRCWNNWLKEHLWLSSVMQVTTCTCQSQPRSMLSIFDHLQRDKCPGRCYAGMPLISDPGSGLVAAAAAAGHQVIPIPGPSAFLLALVASGFNSARFTFAGFFPDKAKARQLELQKLAGDSLPASQVDLQKN